MPSAVDVPLIDVVVAADVPSARGPGARGRRRSPRGGVEGEARALRVSPRRASVTRRLCTVTCEPAVVSRDRRPGRPLPVGDREGEPRRGPSLPGAGIRCSGGADCPHQSPARGGPGAAEDGETTCVAGQRCACGGAGCVCTRACGEGLPRCPEPTVCTTTPIGALCLPPAPPPPVHRRHCAADAQVTLDLPVIPTEPSGTDVHPDGVDGARAAAAATTSRRRGAREGSTWATTRFAPTARCCSSRATSTANPTSSSRAASHRRGRGARSASPWGAYIGLSSVGPNYNPPTGCQVDTCGNPSRHSCSENNPPLRAPAGNGVFYWGYAYNGACHMQGWFLVSPGVLTYVGDDGTHPCALGPAGADYEVRSACGRVTRCRGTNPSCGAVNTCEEGNDDCGLRELRRARRGRAPLPRCGGRDRTPRRGPPPPPRSGRAGRDPALTPGARARRTVTRPAARRETPSASARDRDRARAAATPLRPGRDPGGERHPGIAGAGHASVRGG